MNISDNVRSSEDGREILAGPVFTKQTREHKTLVTKNIGDSLSIPCEALGSPAPSISWEHNGHLISKNSTLELRNIDSSDRGIYTCVATNTLGKKEKNFSLSVLAAPILFEMKPITNKSVNIGEEVRLECEVTSSTLPTVQWMKESDEAMGGFEIGGLRVESVGSNRLVNTAVSEYVSTHVIKRAGMRHSVH